MERAQILERLRQIISEVTGFEPEEIGEEDSLSEDIGIESFDIVDINFRIEEELGVRIGEKTFWNLRDIFEDPALIDENNVLTTEGIREVKRRTPNLDPDNTLENGGGVPFTEMLAEIKVKHFVDFIQMNLP